MVKLRFHAHGESLPAEACPEVVAEFDGIRYRAKVTKASSRMFRAELIEPFSRSITCEMPVFVVAMSSFRLVRDGQPTTEMLKLLHSKMETIHQDGLRQSAIEVAFAVNGPRLEGLFREAEARHGNLTTEEQEHARGMTRLVSTVHKYKGKLRREIQPGMRGGRIGREEGLAMLQDHHALRTAAEAQLPEEAKAIESRKTRLDAVRTAKEQVAAEFLKQTGFSLEAFRLFMKGRS